MLDRILDFLHSIGIGAERGVISRPTLVPGVDIVRGTLVADEPAMCKPADLLHEAAHIALTRPADRAQLDGTISSSPAEEVSAIAWTWAAARHLDIDPAETFHDEVISGNGATLRENFTAGRFVGVPMLQYWGLSLEPKRAAERGLEPYPHMIRWLRN